MKSVYDDLKSGFRTVGYRAKANPAAAVAAGLIDLSIGIVGGLIMYFAMGGVC